MPLLMTNETDRVLFAINENLWGIYFEDVDAKSSSAINRWARTHEKMLPLTVYGKPDKGLTSATYDRDREVLWKQHRAICDKLAQGYIVSIPLSDFLGVSDHLSETSPQLLKKLDEYFETWSTFL